MSKFLVIGGSGVMGQAAIKAVREKYGDEANIIANWFGKEDPGFTIEGATKTIFGDISDPSCIAEIQAENDEPFEYMFYATALGEVGVPIAEASEESITQSNRLSFDPIPVLEEKLNIKTIVTYSTFYVIRHQLATYGAMGYSKEAIEKWTLESGKSHRACIRAGLFESQSSRGIKLLLRKSAKNPENLKDPLLKSYFSGKSSKDGIKQFEEGIFSEEKEAYGDCRTNAEDLYQSHLTLFESNDPVFVNVCGKKIWLSKEPQLLKDYF
ncbi:MAG: hypothetical protein VW455_07880 [Nitrospinota bacterium]